MPPPQRETRKKQAPPRPTRVLGSEMVNLKIVFSRGFLHWTRVMGPGDESGAVLTCYQVDYALREIKSRKTEIFF